MSDEHRLQGPRRVLTAAVSTCCQLARPLVGLGAQSLLGCGHILGKVAGALTVPAVATACAFLPPSTCYLLGGAATASRMLKRKQPAGWHAAHLAVHTLQHVSGAFMSLGIMCTVMPYLTPGCWRALQYWQRSIPILLSYIRTGRRARGLLHAGKEHEAHRLWEQQHEEGAQQLFDMLADVKGFYMKLGQILATKTDLLPAAYTSSLSRLMDRLPPAPWSNVRCTLQRELKRPVTAVFSQLDTFPLASATIAQVHVGRLHARGQPWVAVKVQHRGVRRMMQADLANMRLGVELCERLKIDLGFDLGSLVREYQVAVPGETCFDLEAGHMAAVQASLQRRALDDLPQLTKVLIPTVYPELCTSRVLVMSLLQGVPLLHIDAMEEPAHKHALMEALVLAFGVQILCDGLFHTDPHPGNLLACKEPTTGQLQVGLLDFGQMKTLTAAERVRYARLVLALATRDNNIIRHTCRQLGLRIENCGPDFEEVRKATKRKAAPRAYILLNHLAHDRYHVFLLADQSGSQIAAYILFDTRMDMPEARQGPMDHDAHEGWRTTRVPALPRDLFMIMRVMTLLRGVLTSLHVYDVSSAMLWRPFALQALAEVDWVPSSPSHPRTPATSPRQAPRSHLQLAMTAHRLMDCADEGELSSDNKGHVMANPVQRSARNSVPVQPSPGSRVRFMGEVEAAQPVVSSKPNAGFETSRAVLGTSALDMYQSGVKASISNEIQPISSNAVSAYRPEVLTSITHEKQPLELRGAFPAVQQWLGQTGSDAWFVASG